MATQVSDIAVILTQHAAEDLLSLLENILEERLLWKAVPEARTVVELIQECAIVNEKWALLITNGGIPVGSEEFPELVDFVEGMSSTRDGCARSLRQATEALVAAIQGVSVERTDNMININRFHAGMLTLAEACLYPYWNMVYHEGQINLLQLLYGDRTHYHNYHLVGESAGNR